jgi:thiol-disulfide isomerase/thioredoxin
MRTVLACCIGGWLLLTTSTVRAEDNATDATLVKYTELGELVRQNKGKVVVVDLWTTACAPCIEKFPKLVEMQSKYGPDGLVIITVNVDSFVSDPDERATVIAAIQRLLGGGNPSKTKVNLKNVILDEKPELAQAKLRFESVPCMYVFTREGKWWQFNFDKKDDFERLTMLVQEELKKKP